MQYIEGSEALTGYRVKVEPRQAFSIVGYTRIIPPGGKGDGLVRNLIADGRMAALRQAAPTAPWVLGLGSWDPECPKHGYRYTVCIEQTPDTDLSGLPAQDLFRMQIGASDWLRFEMLDQDYERFWKDDPYKMMGPLGYRFHMGDFSVGLHFDAYPPAFDAASNPAIEFWITVVKA
ncbi:MAG: hypothetical protein ACYC5M_11415 [Anaerolineae bacterium]